MSMYVSSFVTQEAAFSGAHVRLRLQDSLVHSIYTIGSVRLIHNCESDGMNISTWGSDAPWDRCGEADEGSWSVLVLPF